jgi:hypothetical protein
MDKIVRHDNQLLGAATTFKQINASWEEHLAYPYDNIQGGPFYHFSSGFFLNSS